MIEDMKILSARFVAPVEIKGAGMQDKLLLGDDPDSGKPRTPGVLATWVAAARAIRVTTPAGETWIPEGTIRSFQPLFDVRPQPNSPIGKRAK